MHKGGICLIILALTEVCKDNPNSQAQLIWCHCVSVNVCVQDRRVSASTVLVLMQLTFSFVSITVFLFFRVRKGYNLKFS